MSHAENAFIDTHCHLDFDAFNSDRDAVLERCRKNGVRDIVVPAVQYSQWQNTIDLCNTYTNCHLALGMHPMFIEHHQPQHLLALSESLEQYTPIAIGEIGLDFYSPSTDKAKQILFFEKQLIIASQTQLPIIVHCRKAHDRVIALLKEHRIVGGIIHAFNGSAEQARHYIELGFALGFGGTLTREHAPKIQQLAKQLPLESMVLETDAPDMALAQFQGQRNSPEHIHLIAEALSALRNVSVSKIATVTSNNAHRIFPRLHKCKGQN